MHTCVRTDSLEMEKKWGNERDGGQIALSHSN